jgi:hypothetical protein
VTINATQIDVIVVEPNGQLRRPWLIELSDSRRGRTVYRITREAPFCKDFQALVHKEFLSPKNPGKI